MKLWKHKMLTRTYDCQQEIQRLQMIMGQIVWGDDPTKRWKRPGGHKGVLTGIETYSGAGRCILNGRCKCLKSHQRGGTMILCQLGSPSYVSSGQEIYFQSLRNGLKRITTGNWNNFCLKWVGYRHLSWNPCLAHSFMSVGSCNMEDSNGRSPSYRFSLGVILRRGELRLTWLCTIYPHLPTWGL